METSLKASFAQIFSCCPKILSCPKFREAAAPLARRCPLNRGFTVYLCDFAKRCPISFRLNTGIARFQAGVAGKKPRGLLSCSAAQTQTYPWVDG